MAKLQKLTAEQIAGMKALGINVSQVPAGVSGVTHTIPPPVPPQQTVKEEKSYGTTAVIQGNKLTLTVDLEDRSLYFDREDNLRTDSKGRIRPYAGFTCIDLNGRKVFFGMSMPDMRKWKL